MVYLYNLKPTTGFFKGSIMRNIIINEEYQNVIFTPAQVEALSEKSKREAAKQSKQKTTRRRLIEDTLLAKGLGLTMSEIS